MLTLLQTGRLDPTPLASHTFQFAELGKAFEIMDKKLDGVVKPLIRSRSTNHDRAPRWFGTRLRRCRRA